MARGVNKVILVGNLGADPEVRYTNSGTAICTFSVATSESWTDKNSGEKQERTEWHRVKAFGRLGEIAGEYLVKGRQVYVEGSIRTEKYTDRQGVERYAVDVVAAELQFLGGGEGGGHGASGGHSGRQASGDGRQAAGGAHRGASREPASREPAARPGPGAGGGVDDGAFADDEIPF